MSKKPYINRKEAKHFYLVHRSQRDPLINDEEASQRVFQEMIPANLRKHKTKEKNVGLQPKQINLTQDEVEQRVGQAALHGIYYDDAEYDYMQHLKPIGNEGAVLLDAPGKKEKEKKSVESMIKDDPSTIARTTTIQLPKDVLPSETEMDVGLMNQHTGLEGGLQPDMDPRLREVLEALEDEEYVEDELDDFFDEMNAEGDVYVPEDEEEEEYEDGAVEGTGYDWQAAFRNFKRTQRGPGSDDGLDEDRQSKGTGFSVSSSAMLRNSQLRLLDDRYDMMEEKYMQDDEPSDDEEGEERQDFDAILDDFLENYQLVGKKLHPKQDGETPEDELKSIRTALLEAHLDDNDNTPSSDTIESDLWERPVSKRLPWDCQSVLSTYSNLENHPRLISDRGVPKQRISIDPKTGMPVLIHVERKNKKAAGTQPIDESASNESSSEDEGQSRANLGASRAKEETKEEKKARKQAIKEARKSRREEKKNTQAAFKTEEGRQRLILNQQKMTKNVKHIP